MFIQARDMGRDSEEKYEPLHDKFTDFKFTDFKFTDFKFTDLGFAPNKDSDRSGHLPSLINLRCKLNDPYWVAKHYSFLHADIGSSDQTGEIKA